MNEFEKNFDKYAYQMGRWVYDNGWGYADQFFGAAYIGECFDGTEADCLLMLREGDDRQQTYIVHNRSGQLSEVWSRQIGSEQDFEKMTQRVTQYAMSYKNRLSEE